MKRRNSLMMLAVAAVAAFAVVPAYAQLAAGSERGIRGYNPATEVTVKGTVEEVRQVSGRMGWSGTHLTVKTDKETLDVHLGPADFVAAGKLEIAKGDQVEVTGSRVKYEGADALLAREVRKGEKVLTLRDVRGIPLWPRGRWQ